MLFEHKLEDCIIRSWHVDIGMHMMTHTPCVALQTVQRTCLARHKDKVPGDRMPQCRR